MKGLFSIRRWMATTDGTGFLLGMLFGLLYCVCAAPGLTWGDSGEFASVAVTLGVPHPTGYPLYVLLSKLWTSLPFWSPARGLNLFSALAGAAAVWALYVFAREALRQSLPRLKSKHIAWIALTATVLFGASPTFFSQAVETEVYTLGVFLQLMTWVALLRWWRGRSPLAGYFFWLGLGLAHHLSLVLLVPFQLVLVLAGFRQSDKEESELLSAAPWALPGLCLYLYLPIRAHTGPVINWGEPTGLAGLLWMVQGGDFRGMLQFDPLLQRGAVVLFFAAMEHVQRLFREFSFATLFLLVLLFVGIPRAWRVFSRPSKQDRSGWMGQGDDFWFAVMTAAVVFSSGLLSFYQTGDREVFFLLTYPLTAVLIGWTMGVLAMLLEQRPVCSFRLFWLMTGVGLGIAVSQGVYSVNTHCARWDTGAENFGRDVLHHLPEGSLLLVGLHSLDTDNSIYPLWYQKWGLGRAEGVVVVGANFLTSPWIRSQFQEEPVWFPTMSELLARGLVREVPGMGTPFVSRGAWVEGVRMFLERNREKFTLYTLSQLPELKVEYRMTLVAEVEVNPGSVSEEYRRHLPRGQLYRLESVESGDGTQ